MLTAIVGINWGDEGKGRIVDLVSQEYDIVCRYQGGNNAGHTVINDKGKFILNLLPSGILREDNVNIMGNGMVIDMKHLCGEMDKLIAGGIKITPDNLKISERAVIVMPYHIQLDCLEEERLAGKKFGSTRRGIAPVYSDKYAKKIIMMGDLFEDEAVLREKVAGIVEYKNLLICKGYGADPVSVDEMMDYLKTYGDRLKPFVINMSKYLNDQHKAGKKILFEAQLGALRDIDFGINPYTSSSNSIAAYAPIGAGVPNLRLDKSIGIMKAYSSCVGEGPFTVELGMSEEDKKALRDAGGEYGAATGRPRRVGAFDVVASKYGVMCQGADEVALTKVDVLSYMDKIPVCVAYNINGKITTDFPRGKALDDARPVIEYLPGWKCDISKCRKPEELPKEAYDYIKFIEEKVGCNISLVSVGAEREAYMLWND
jgi:adenylosuccinate synthase